MVRSPPPTAGAAYLVTPCTVSLTVILGSPLQIGFRGGLPGTLGKCIGPVAAFRPAGPIPRLTLVVGPCQGHRELSVWWRHPMCLVKGQIFPQRFLVSSCGGLGEGGTFPMEHKAVPLESPCWSIAKGSYLAPTTGAISLVLGQIFHSMTP